MLTRLGHPTHWTIQGNRSTSYRAASRPSEKDGFSVSFAGSKTQPKTKLSPEEVQRRAEQAARAPEIRKRLPAVLKIWAPTPPNSIVKHGHLEKMRDRLAENPLHQETVKHLDALLAADTPTAGTLKAQAESYPLKIIFNTHDNFMGSQQQTTQYASLLMQLPDGAVKDLIILNLTEQVYDPQLLQLALFELDHIQNPVIKTRLRQLPDAVPALRKMPGLPELLARLEQTGRLSSDEDEALLNAATSAVPAIDLTALAERIKEKLTSSHGYDHYIGLKALYALPPELKKEIAKKHSLTGAGILSTFTQGCRVRDYGRFLATAVGAKGIAKIQQSAKNGKYGELGETPNFSSQFEQRVEAFRQMEQSGFGALYAEGLTPYFQTGLSFRNFPVFAETLQLCGLDEGRLITHVLPEYEDVLDFAIRHPDRLVSKGDLVPNEQVIRTTYKFKEVALVNAIIVLGAGTVKKAIDQKMLDPVLALIPQIMKAPTIVKLLHAVKSFNVDPANLHRLMNYAAGFREFKAASRFEELLAAMVEKQELDMSLLGREFLKIALAHGGLKVNDISDDVLATFDMHYVNMLAHAMVNNGNSETGKQLRQLLHHTVEGTYWEYLFDETTDVGQANHKTRAAFDRAGLNFERWLDYDGSHEFFHTATGQRLKVEFWKRQAGHDLFMGNYTGACIQMGSHGGGERCVKDLHSTFVQVAFLKTQDDRVVGKALFFWAYNKRTRRPVLILNTFEGRGQGDSGYEGNREVRNAYREFARQLTVAVAGKERPVYTGDHLNPLYKTKASITRKTLKLIGYYPWGGYYLDSLPNGSNGNLREQEYQKATVYKLFTPQGGWLRRIAKFWTT